MTGFWSFVLYLVGWAMAIWCIADAGRNFTEKKWGWFGFSTCLAIYWMAWIICHSLVG